MPATYIDPFGGGVVRPSPVSYRSLVAGVNPLQLVWAGYDESSYYVASKIDVTSALSGQIIYLPPANVVSVGESILFSNLSSETIEIQTYQFVTVGTIAPGASRLVYLVSNTTEGGAWRTVLYGVGSGSLDAAAIAGAGLEASGALVRLDWPVESKTTNFTVDATYRAKTQVWQGGTGTASFDFASALGSGFLMGIRNQGTGALLLDPAFSDFIDTFSAGFVIQPGDSCLVYCDGGVNLWTIGLGRKLQFNFTRLEKSISGSVALTLNEASNVVQEYTGSLAGPATITLPGTIQVYYVTNSTLGGFALTFTCGGLTSLVAAGASAVLVCDGINVRQIAGGGLVAGEGTFTPTVLGATTAGVTTYTKQAGVYQKIGSWVHFQLDVRWSAATGTGQLIVDGLPFPIAASPAAQSFPVFSQGAADLFAQGRTGTQIDFFNNNAFTQFAITGTGNLRISGSYLAA